MDQQTLTRAGIRVGQIWREVDPRHERFVRIEDASQLRILIQTVIKIDGEWKQKPRTIGSWAQSTRFSGKPGGYALVEQP